MARAWGKLLVKDDGVCRDIYLQWVSRDDTRPMGHVLSRVISTEWRNVSISDPWVTDSDSWVTDTDISTLSFHRESRVYTSIKYIQPACIARTCTAFKTIEIQTTPSYR